MKNKIKGTFHSWCKECHLNYSKYHYKQNTQYYLQKARRRNEKTSIENKIKYVDYLKSHSCVDCGESDILKLTFDHVRGKKYDIGQMLGRFKWESILDEIKKCEVRCGSCHIKRHAIENGWKDILRACG